MQRGPGWAGPYAPAGSAGAARPETARVACPSRLNERRPARLARALRRGLIAAHRSTGHDIAVNPPRVPIPTASNVITRLELLASGPGGLLLVGLWGFTEAIVLPVVPDVVLGLLALAAPRRAIALFGALLVGSLAGTALLFLSATLAPDAITSIDLALPGISATMLADAQRTVAAGDPMALALFGPGPPLKVFTLTWAIGPGTILPLTVGAAINRLTRVGPGLIALAVIGAVAPGWIRRYERPVLLAYGAFWIVVYAFYLG